MLEAEESAQNPPRRLPLTQGERPLLDWPGRAIAKRSLMSWAARRPWEGRRRRSPKIRGWPTARHPFPPLRIRAGARPGSDPESGIGVFGTVSDPGRRLELASLGLWPAAARSPAAAFAATSIHAGGPKRRNRRTVDGAWRRPPQRRLRAGAQRGGRIRPDARRVRNPVRGRPACAAHPANPRRITRPRSMSWSWSKSGVSGLARRLAAGSSSGFRGSIFRSRKNRGFFRPGP